MNATAVDIKGMLEHYAENVDSSDCSIELFPIYIGKEPAEPFNTISIFETGVFGPQLTMDRNEIYEYASVQIRVRANHYNDGWQMISFIKNSLHGRANITWNGTFYALIRCSISPFLLDFDKNQRVRFVVNFYVQRR